MATLALGFVVSLLAIAPVGPISLSIIGVGVTQGRSRGSQAGLGASGGDVLSCTAAVAVVALGQSLPEMLFAVLQTISTLALFGFGLTMILGASRLQLIAASINRPLPTLLAATALSPLTFGSWLALFIAMPFSSELSSLSLFASGGVAASLFWHPLLGASAGTFGPRLQPRTITTIARLGGLFLLGTACYLGFRQLA